MASNNHIDESSRNAIAPRSVLVHDIFAKKSRGEKIVMLTAYDYPLAVILDQAGVDIILVGDSLANVVLGLDSTTQVGMEVMLHHVKAVVRGVKRSPVVADMPFEAYQADGADAAGNARLFIEAGCAAVKVEWFDRCLEVVKVLVKAGIPVIGHVGVTPQTAEHLGGFKVQGKDDASASRIMKQSMSLQEAGCLALVIECVPEGLARDITSTLKIPTIGIGAGQFCDGQVLVLHDMLGLYDRKAPKFVKKYANIGSVVLNAVKQYKTDVEDGKFPGPQETFH